MDSGKLRYPALIVREIKEVTASGAETVTYEDVLNTRVGIKTVSGREFIEGGAELMETTVKIVARNNEDAKRVLAGDIVRANNREYQIVSILDFDTNKSYQFMCKEIL